MRCGFENSGIALFCARCSYPLKPEQVVREDLEIIRKIDQLARELEKLKKEFKTL